MTSASSTRALRLAAQHAAQRRGDLALGEDAGRDLVEQRLEQVVVGAVDEGDLDRRASERLRRVEAAEASTDDEDAMCAGVMPPFYVHALRES